MAVLILIDRLHLFTSYRTLNHFRGEMHVSPSILMDEVTSRQQITFLMHGCHMQVCATLVPHHDLCMSRIFALHGPEAHKVHDCKCEVKLFPLLCLFIRDHHQVQYSTVIQYFCTALLIHMNYIQCGSCI